MKKMLKRADGSTSQRGLWDNIRAKAAANKKAGKKGKAPSKAILEQERKIEEKKMGGNWMEDSKELKFGGLPKPKKYQTAPPPPSGVNFLEDLKAQQAAEEPVKSNPSTPRFTVGPTNFAGSGEGYGGSGYQCLSGDCKDVVEREGQAATQPRETGISRFNATKKRHGDKVVKLTKAQIAEQQAQADQDRADMKARKIAEKAQRDANNAAALEEIRRSQGRATEDSTMQGLEQKTGGRRNYFKK
jgi:hypothetical protein